MSEEAKVKIEVLRPGNPLAPMPKDAVPGQAEMDALLLRLPEFQEEASDREGAKQRLAERLAARTARLGNKPKRNPQERVRNLSAAEQQKIARTGEQPERVALERMYGKAVWETLLNNSRITPPEVLRIARMASLPLPLIELIVANRGWLTSPQVRRALLSNHRLSKDQVMTVLRATPKSALRLMNKQTAYPAAVREAAATFFRQG